MNRTTRVLVVSALTAATLSACGNDGGHDMNTMSSTNPGTSATSSPGASASGTHNDSDVAFATYMIPHHGQALEMAQLAASRANDPQVKTLAKHIQAAQGPEIKQMSSWLKAWGEPVPAATAMQHGDGMMTMDEMGQLETATGTTFDKMWLTMMIKHHKGAIEMARTELTEGSEAAAKRLAQAIVDGQSKEIATMTSLLDGS